VEGRWGGPPGPRGTPPSRIRNDDIGILQGTSRPARGPAADEGVRPTGCADVRQREKYAALRSESALWRGLPLWDETGGRNGSSRVYTRPRVPCNRYLRLGWSKEPENGSCANENEY
jgi:hypothetical protein